MITKNKYWGNYGLILVLTIMLASILTACSATSSATSASQPDTNNSSQSGNSQAPVPENAGPGSFQGQGIAGTIAKLEGNVMTLTTSQGETTINISSGTTIQKLVDGTKADLQTGLFLIVMGIQNTDNSVTATSVTIRPSSEVSFSNPPMTMAPRPSGSPIPTSNTARPNNFGPGVMGTLSNVDGNTLTLTFGQETTTVTINDDTKIQKIVSIAVSDFKTGNSVIASGDKDDNGNINATSIMVGQMDQMSIPGSQGNLPPAVDKGVPQSN